MFNFLRRFSTIVVTGPQRSGTRIATQMIASDLKREYIQEEAFEIHDFEGFWALLSRTAVIHAPAMSAYCHLLPKRVAIVFMRRNIEEIRASQSRVLLPTGNTWSEDEEQVELAKYFLRSGRSAEVKYEKWERFQRPNIRARRKHCFELAYEALHCHPLWAPTEERIGWRPSQTKTAPASAVLSSPQP